MNRQWLALLKEKKLYCHLCGLLILSRKDLSADHSPVPRSKGGTQVKPAHKWCDSAQADKGFCVRRIYKDWWMRGKRTRKNFRQQFITVLTH